MHRQNSLGTLAGRPYTEAVQLLEREDELGVLHAALEGAIRGQGSGIALAGDSGVGKSTLIEAVCKNVTGARVLRGHCDPLDTPRPLGPFRDLHQLSGIDGFGRGEDLLLSEVCEQVYAALCREPTVLVVEDLHWVDAASVDVLRFLARRIESMPLALIVSYRNREIGARHSARPLLGDVASAGRSPPARAEAAVGRRRPAPARGHPARGRTGPRGHRRQPVLRRRGSQGARSPDAHLGS